MLLRFSKLLNSTNHELTPINHELNPLNLIIINSQYYDFVYLILPYLKHLSHVYCQFHNVNKFNL